MYPPPPVTVMGGAVWIFILSLLGVLILTVAEIQCPPFKSALEFPFSSKLGYGHPCFHIKCTSPHSIIAINNVSFALLGYQHNSTSLLLSPTHSTESAAASQTQNQNCSSLDSIPSRSINFSGSPFRVSDSSCSKLQSLESCSIPNKSNCSRCSWECKLIKNPVEILQQCGPGPSTTTRTQRCKTDVLGYLDRFLKLGIEVEFDEFQDPYFTNCRDCKLKNGVCGYNSSEPSKKFLCFESKSKSNIPNSLIHQGNSNRVAILTSVFALTCVFLSISLIIAVFRSKRLKLSSSEEDPTSIFLHRFRSANLLPPVFTYEELETSTNKFDPKRKIGDGGFGSVYLGQLSDRRIVAVKYLHKFQNIANSSQSFTTKSFCNEILILSSINHPNLVKLHGYCSDPRGLLLVYDYVPNGTLADHLHGPNRNQSRLTWQVRLEIALQIALAIEYLHMSVVPAIVHRDITCSNIFVEKDMRIKLGDFGLSRLLVETPSSSSSGYVWTGPQGTPGYLDPDYHRSFRLTEKSDVYSFGVVLLELITGLRPVDQRRDKREISLADLVVAKIQMGLLHQVVDPLLPVDGVDAVAELAFRCVAFEKDDRPDAREIVEELKRIRCRTRGG